MLQRSLLPRRLPELPGGTAVARYLPARRGLQVGGDWYDVIALSEDRVALVIGDVQGHSAGAATIMGQMRTAVRAYAVEGHPPDVVVAHANRLLVGMETDLFATCCYAELDLEQGNTLFVRAGHLAPLVRHPDGSTEEIEVEGGLPLGIMEEAEFPMTAVELTPGTVLALLTDGLVEAADLSIDEGMQQTRTALAAADPADLGRMADRLLGDVGRREDDVALLLLRYDGMRTRPIRAGWVVWRLPDAVMHARRFTARTLRHWKAEDVADAVMLVVSELVTNALVHTQGAVRLDLMLRGDRVRVCVSDSSPRAPAKPVIVDWESTGGRGLLLVEAMSESFGSMPVAGGKQVWSEIAVPPREPAPAEPESPPARGACREGPWVASRRGPRRGTHDDVPGLLRQRRQRGHGQLRRRPAPAEPNGPALGALRQAADRETGQGAVPALHDGVRQRGGRRRQTAATGDLHDHQGGQGPDPRCHRHQGPALLDPGGPPGGRTGRRVRPARAGPGLRLRQFRRRAGRKAPGARTPEGHGGKAAGEQIVMLNGDPTSPNAAWYRRGAMSVIAGKVKIGRSYDTQGWSADNAHADMSAAIAALGPDRIGGVLAANDEIAGGAISALKRAGVRQLPPVTGQDADLAAVQRIVAGEQYMTVYKRFGTEAAAAAAMAVTLGRGDDLGKVAETTTDSPTTRDIPSILLTPSAVTVRDVRRILVGGGVYTVDEICTREYRHACEKAGLAP